jgi:hypothetical protein
MRRISVIFIAVALAVATGTLVAYASGGGLATGQSASGTQYVEKPGCGPDGTMGQAGSSGVHGGQGDDTPQGNGNGNGDPHQNQNEHRVNCPHPPGQQGNTCTSGQRDALDPTGECSYSTSGPGGGSGYGSGKNPAP